MAIHTLSDYNSPYSRASRTSIPQDYADLPLSLAIHPNTKDITPLTDIDAIKQSVKNIILTNHGERLFRPKYGGNVTSYLFENPDKFVEISMKEEIKELLSKYESRIDQIVVQVMLSNDESQYNVTIGFRIMNAGSQHFMEFSLERTR